MKRKVQTCLITRFTFVLALLFSAGQYSFAQSTFSSPVEIQDSTLSGASVSLEESASSHLKRKKEYLLSDSIQNKTQFNTGKTIKTIYESIIDTSDTSQISRDFQITLEGEEGWRFMTTPTRPLSFAELLESVWIQGISDSNDPIAAVPNLLAWSEENNGFTQEPPTMSSSMEAGKSYLVYFFEDDVPSEQGIQGGFPKQIRAQGKEITNPVSVRITATDQNENNQIDHNEGWNLLGNPFNASLSVDKVKSIFRAAGDSLSEYVYVWNRAKEGAYNGFQAIGTEGNIAPYEAFFVKIMGEKEVNFTADLNKEELVEDQSSTGYREVTGEGLAFSLQISNQDVQDNYQINFSERGSIGLNKFDAFKLSSLQSPSLFLYGRKGSAKIQENSLPSNFNSSIEIPIGYDYSLDGELVFSWENLKSLPHEWSLTLQDTERNIEIDLRTNSDYRFNHKKKQDVQPQTPSKIKRPTVIDSDEIGSERFILSINPGKNKLLGEDKPENIQLKPNYPNPFNRETFIAYELAEDTEITLSIWNMIGQKVETLVDERVEAGTHRVSWIASSMPSGMYIARLEVGDQVFTRKMTLIK